MRIVVEIEVLDDVFSYFGYIFGIWDYVWFEV